MKFLLVFLLAFGLSITTYAESDCRIGDSGCSGTTTPDSEPIPSESSVGSGNKTHTSGIESTNCHNNEVSRPTVSKWRQYAKSLEGGAGQSGSNDGNN